MKKRNQGARESSGGAVDGGQAAESGSIKAWCGWDEPEAEPPAGHPWPSWACWLVSALLLFHIAAIVVCELGGQVNTSSLELTLGRKLVWYAILIHEDYAHAFFAPEPETSAGVLTARLQFGPGQPERELRIPDPSARPRIRYLRQYALAWHLVHEWSGEGPFRRPHWADSYARHLCRANPGCTRVELIVREHRMPDLQRVYLAAAQGDSLELDSDEMYNAPISVGVYSCQD